MKEILKDFAGYDVYVKSDSNKPNHEIALEILDVVLLCTDYDVLEKSLEEIK